MKREEWELYRDRWHQHNVETNLSQWLKAKALGLESSICSVEGCLRDAIGFMWADKEDIQALRKNPGLRDKNKTRAEELKDELQKCIFHTDKENEIWIENWDGEMERWKRERDGVLKRARVLKEEIFHLKFENENLLDLYRRKINKELDDLNHILGNWSKDHEWKNDRIKEFWRLIREYKDVEFNPDLGNENGRWGIKEERTYNFSLFVFPEFEEINIERDDDGDFVVQMDFSFWKRGEIYKFPYNYDIFFNDSIFIGITKFDNATFEDVNVHFDNAVFIKDFNFSKVKVKCNNAYCGISFHMVLFLHKSNFSETDFINYYNYTNKNNIKIMRADFSYAVFMGYTDFKKIVFPNILISEYSGGFIEAEFVGDVEFSESKFVGLDIFPFKNINVWKSMNFKKSSFLSKHGNYASIIFENINPVIKGRGDIIISGTRFSYIVLRNLNLKSLTISFINHRLTPDNFLIHNLDISDPDGTIHFESVYLEDLKFVNVNWGEVSPKRISRELYEKDPRAARDIYRQIKLALDKQENYIDARKFYALELQAHGRELEMEIRDSSFPIISWIFGKIIDVSGRLLYSQDTLRTIYLQITATLLRLLGVSLYLIPVLLIFLLLAYHTSLAPIIFLLLLFFIAVPHYRFPFLRTISALNSLVIYYLYGLTANFGLSWLRPLMWLIGTVSAYTYVENRVDKWGEFVGWVFPEKFAQVISKISENLNQFASNFLQFLPTQNLCDKERHSFEDHSFLTLVFFILSSYLIYQTIVALRRRVRR